MRDDRLEVEVSERTAEILTTQQQLQATLRAIHDLLFELDLHGTYYSAHSVRPELLYRPVSEIIGKSVTEMLPPEAADAVLAALQEANERGLSTGSAPKG